MWKNTGLSSGLRVFFQLMQLKQVCLSACLVPWHKFTPLQIVEEPQHLFHSPRQASAGRSHLECQSLEIQALKISRKKSSNHLKILLQGAWESRSKTIFQIKLQLMYKIQAHRDTFSINHSFLPDFLKKKMTLAFETVICREFNAD